MNITFIFQHDVLKKVFLIVLFHWLCLSGSSEVIGETIPVSSERLMEIEGTWTRQVVDREPVNDYGNNGTVSLRNLSNGTLYFRTVIRGFEGALAALEARRYLQLNYIWHYTLFTITERTTVTIPKIGKLTAKELSGLSTELQSRGFFDWRSWSYYPVWLGEWRVEIEIVKPEGITLKCGEKIGHCEFKITVVQ